MVRPSAQPKLRFSIPSELFNSSRKQATLRGHSMKMYGFHAVCILNEATRRGFGTTTRLLVPDGDPLELPHLKRDDESTVRQAFVIRALRGSDELTDLYRFAENAGISNDERVVRALRLANFICEVTPPGSHLEFRHGDERPHVMLATL